MDTVSDFISYVKLDISSVKNGTLPLELFVRDYCGVLFILGILAMSCLLMLKLGRLVLEAAKDTHTCNDNMVVLTKKQVTTCMAPWAISSVIWMIIASI